MSWRATTCGRAFKSETGAYSDPYPLWRHLETCLGLPQLQDAAAVAGKGGEQLREEPLAAAHKPELRPPARTGRLRNGSAG